MGQVINIDKSKNNAADNMHHNLTHQCAFMFSIVLSKTKEKIFYLISPFPLSDKLSILVTYLRMNRNIILRKLKQLYTIKLSPL